MIHAIESLRPLCEERVVVLHGHSEVSGREALMKYGKAEEHEYRNQRGEIVRWRFVRIEKGDGH